MPSGAGTWVSAVALRLQPHVELKHEETRKLIGRLWGWCIVARVVLIDVTDWVFVFYDGMSWCVEKRYLGTLELR
jgi:hypothetical protein